MTKKRRGPSWAEQAASMSPAERARFGEELRDLADQLKKADAASRTQARDLADQLRRVDVVARQFLPPAPAPAAQGELWPGLRSVRLLTEHDKYALTKAALEDPEWAVALGLKVGGPATQPPSPRGRKSEVPWAQYAAFIYADIQDHDYPGKRDHVGALAEGARPTQEDLVQAVLAWGEERGYRLPDIKRLRELVSRMCTAARYGKAGL